MFSGIIEEIAIVKQVATNGTNKDITLSCSFTDELQIDQSVSHNGVCLTVIAISEDTYTVTAIEETLEKSNIGRLTIDDKVNIERSIKMDGRLDGHIVQGHVDRVGECTSVKTTDGSWYYSFKYENTEQDKKAGFVTVEKGSITVNGVSLTVVNSQENRFEVAIIPYTHEHTNFHTFQTGSIVNLEFDIVGKYLAKMIG